MAEAVGLLLSLLWVRQSASPDDQVRFVTWTLTSVSCWTDSEVIHLEVFGSYHLVPRLQAVSGHDQTLIFDWSLKCQGRETTVLSICSSLFQIHTISING